LPFFAIYFQQLLGLAQNVAFAQLHDTKSSSLGAPLGCGGRATSRKFSNDHVSPRTMKMPTFAPLGGEGGALPALSLAGAGRAYARRREMQAEQTTSASARRQGRGSSRNSTQQSFRLRCSSTRPGIVVPRISAAGARRRMWDAHRPPIESARATTRGGVGTILAQSPNLIITTGVWLSSPKLVNIFPKPLQPLPTRLCRPYRGSSANPGDCAPHGSETGKELRCRGGPCGRPLEFLHFKLPRPG